MSENAAPDAPAVTADLVITGARLLVTMDASRRELAGGWVAITGGQISGIGDAGSEPPPAHEVIKADGCLVTPGLINTHHHIYQNLTRAFAPAVSENLFGWLTALYPLWAKLDEEAAYLSAWVGLAELALGGCTTSMDHLYVHPKNGGDLLTAEITAASELGMRFHPTRGSMSLSVKDGGLPPDSVVQDDDEILADCEAQVGRHHDPSPNSMLRIALAPCSPFSVTPELMTRTAELAERLDVRLHTHLAEDADEDVYCLETFGRRPVDHFEEVGWGTNRTWVAHCIYPNPAEVERLGKWGVGVAHCPSSNLILGNGGLAPIKEMRAAGVPVGIGCDGSSSADSASLWLETRMAMLLGRLRHGTAGMSARDALEIATLGGAACLGRQGEIGELSVGAAGDVVVWPLEGFGYAGAISDPVEALLRTGPNAPRHTIVNGKSVVRDGLLVHPGGADILTRHRAAATRIQAG
jgi:cytosine/adenosine deaminase-related metal-dependent hydrolase